MTDRIEPALTQQEWSERRAPVGTRLTASIGEQASHGNRWLDIVDTRGERVEGVYFVPDERIPALTAIANAALPDDDPRKITREWAIALRCAVDWAIFLERDTCPKCDGAAFKMSCPPICVSCGWKSAIHPQSIAETQLAIADALESYLPPSE